MRSVLLVALLAASAGTATAPARGAVSPAALVVALPDSAAADTLGEAAESAAADTASHAAGSAGAAADTSLRVPGMRLRFGWSLARAQAQTPLAAAKSPVRAEVVREGKMAWFGVPADVTLHFRRDRLATVNVAVKAPAPNARDYVEDSLLREGYRRECTRLDRTGHDCTWRGPANVQLRNFPERMDATIIVAPPAPPKRAAPPPPREVAIYGETLVFGRPGASGVAAPVVAFRPEPAFPQAARAAGVQGNVWVRALVDTSGAVMEASILRGIAELDSAAIDAARRWRFERFTPGGEPRRVRVEFPVRFVLH